MKPRLLDLFAGAGGAARGYQLAGFHVTGIDNKPQPRYAGDVFIQADALNPPVRLEDFDVIHASPPCQAFSSLKSAWNAKKHEDLLTPTREMLQEAGVPWIIENVDGAPMRGDFILCGTMFGLGTKDAELRRHRFFETSWPMQSLVPPCYHGRRHRVIGVYGGHGRDRRRTVGTQDFTVAERQEAMDVHWVSGQALNQAIPPAFTAFLGAQLLDFLSLKASTP